MYGVSEVLSFVSTKESTKEKLVAVKFFSLIPVVRSAAKRKLVASLLKQCALSRFAHKESRRKNFNATFLPLLH